MKDVHVLMNMYCMHRMCYIVNLKKDIMQIMHVRLCNMLQGPVQL